MFASPCELVSSPSTSASSSARCAAAAAACAVATLPAASSCSSPGTSPTDRGRTLVAPGASAADLVRARFAAAAAVDGNDPDASAFIAALGQAGWDLETPLLDDLGHRVAWGPG
mgnify:CR=1 FL=1